MIDLPRTLEHVCLLAELSPEQAQPYLPLCLAAIQELEAQLLPRAAAPEWQQPLAMAAAGMVLYRLALLHSLNQSESMQIGDISFSGRLSLPVAQAAKAELLAMLAPVLRRQAGCIIPI